MLGHTTKSLCPVHKDVALHKTGAMPHLGHKLPRTPYTRVSQIMPLSRSDWLLLRRSHKRSVHFCTIRDKLPDLGQMRARHQVYRCALSGEDASPPGTLRALLRAFSSWARSLLLLRGGRLGRSWQLSWRLYLRWQAYNQAVDNVFLQRDSSRPPLPSNAGARSWCPVDHPPDVHDPYQDLCHAALRNPSVEVALDW
jgi:hypothetical protein